MKTVQLILLLCMIIFAVVKCAVEEKDLYGTLGISRDASQREIKKAFRKLSRKYHPDKNPGDQEAANKFTAIAEVHEINEWEWMHGKLVPKLWISQKFKRNSIACLIK